MKHISMVVVICLGLGFAVGSVWSQQQVDVAKLPFSPARVAGDTVYVSGQIPVRADGSTVTGDVAEQTRVTMENIERILKDNGCTFDDVVNVTVYLSDMKHYADMNAAYREFFPNEFPARACVGGLQLAFGADLEISAIAHKSSR